MATHAILTGTQEKGSPKSLQQNIQENTTISLELNVRMERFYQLWHLVFQFAGSLAQYFRRPQKSLPTVVLSHHNEQQCR